MEIILFLHLCLGHHENYSLGLICILKLPLKFPVVAGVTSAELIHMKAREEHGICLQLYHGVWLNQCAETLRWALTAAGSYLSSLYIQVSPNDSFFISEMVKKKTKLPLVLL